MNDDFLKMIPDGFCDEEMRCDYLVTKEIKRQTFVCLLTSPDFAVILLSLFMLFWFLFNHNVSIFHRECMDVARNKTL